MGCAVVAEAEELAIKSSPFLLSPVPTGALRNWTAIASVAIATVEVPSGFVIFVSTCRLRIILTPAESNITVFGATVPAASCA